MRENLIGFISRDYPEHLPRNQRTLESTTGGATVDQPATAFSQRCELYRAALRLLSGQSFDPSVHRGAPSIILVLASPAVRLPHGLGDALANNACRPGIALQCSVESVLLQD